MLSEYRFDDFTLGVSEVGVIQTFEGHAIDPWLKSLSAVELAALDAILIEKGGRLYFQCPIRKKDILAKPEECVRQYWLHLLQATYMDIRQAA